MTDDRGSGRGRYSPDQVQQVIDDVGILPTPSATAEAIAELILGWQGATPQDSPKLYLTHPDVNPRQPVYRLCVEVLRGKTSILYDALLPNDGKPVGDRIRDLVAQRLGLPVAGWWSSEDSVPF